MTEYELLDHIADNVNPVLGVFALIWAWVIRKKTRLGGIAGNLATLASVALVYVLGAIDSSFHIWRTLGMDFSTHTGVCVAVIVSLWWLDARVRIPAVAIGVAYAILMLYQKYHSAADILTTAIVVASTSIGVWMALKRVISRKS